jgi:predicted Zn-dependent peptidase
MSKQSKVCTETKDQNEHLDTNELSIDGIHIELDNKMQVVIIPSDLKSKSNIHGLVYVSLVMRNGRVDETNHTWSYTHMSEHLFAKLTSHKYPRYEDVKGEMGFLGIQSNAFTKLYETGYWFIGEEKNLNFILDVLLSAFFEYTFTDDWKKQRNILIEEIKSRNSGIWNQFEEDIRIALYKDHRLGVTWKQELNVISQASQHQVVNYLKQKLDPACSTLLIEGSMSNVSSILKQIETIAASSKVRKVKSKSTSAYKQRIESLKIFDGPQLLHVPVSSSSVSRIVFIFQIPEISIFNRQDKAKVMCLHLYFCNGYYSRLYQILREKHGLVYGIETACELSPIPQQIPGEFMIDIKVDPQNVKQVIEIVHAEIERVKHLLVSDREVQQLHNHLNFQESLQILNHRPGKYADNCAMYTTWNKSIRPFSEPFNKMRNVQAYQIRDIARRIFKDEHKLIAIGDGSQISRKQKTLTS